MTHETNTPMNLHQRRDDTHPAGPPTWDDAEKLASRGGMVHAMIDIETLGTKPGAVILSIGAVMFGAAGIGAPFYAPVQIQSCTDVGLAIDASTVTWWIGQSDEARAAAFRADAAPLRHVLMAFYEWFADNGARYVWCHGATFDAPLLEAAFQACGLVAPWKFQNVRDTRTLYDLAGVKPDRCKGTHHNALDDAMNQAEAAVKAMNLLAPRVSAERADFHFSQSAPVGAPTPTSAREAELLEALQQVKQWDIDGWKERGFALPTELRAKIQALVTDTPTAANAAGQQRWIDADRDKWKLVDGDCREGADGLITYHVAAFDEGYKHGQSARPAAADADAVVGWQNRIAPDQIVEGMNPPDRSDKWVPLVYANRAPATSAAGQTSEWSHDLQARLMAACMDFEQDDEVRQLLAEAACALAELRGRPAAKGTAGQEDA